MAQSGRVYLIGSGANRTNPIHRADVAKACVASVAETGIEVSLGGPDTCSTREIGEPALGIAGRQAFTTERLADCLGQNDDVVSFVGLEVAMSKTGTRSGALRMDNV